VPALVCFAAYLWLSLTDIPSYKIKQGDVANSPLLTSSWLRATCRAGVTVMLVGLWLSALSVSWAPGCFFGPCWSWDDKTPM